jgi:hypothetical protein
MGEKGGRALAGVKIKRICIAFMLETIAVRGS